jgi:hypothetical protein
MPGTTRRARAARLAVAALVVAAVAAAVYARARGGGGDGAGGVVEAGGDPEAVRTLAAVRSAMARAPSFRFQFQGIDTTMAYWDEWPRRFTGEGAWSADRWRLVTRDQNDASETIVVGDTVYSRWPDRDEALEQEPWTCWQSREDEPLPWHEVLDDMSITFDEIAAEEGEVDAGLVDQLGVALAAGLYLDGTLERVDWADAEVEVSHFPGDPTSFVEAIGRDGTTRLLGRAPGLTTLGITVRAPDDVVDAFGRPVPSGRVELDVGPGDLPAALRVHVAGGSEAFDLDVTFSDWGSPADVEAPAAGGC